MTSRLAAPQAAARDSVAVEQVIAHVRGLIERRALRP